MASNFLYYCVKPYLPWHLRIFLRRALARKKREAFANTWPINESAGRPPLGWPGWPEGKKFAFVITHDVEGAAGLSNCRQLMRLDERHDIRSSFNFIPEGEYSVSRDFREELQKGGFEVGVHDLRHDGFLYRSRASFSADARCINRYVKEWNVKGFRSGFMHHRLDWLKELEILYDASTFDVDPFEPQPDGVKTIFPFWVPTLGVQGGYVELPYTLAQDFSLFVVLQERTIEIWKRKLDWIAAHGGMALLIVHPDYVNFSNSWNEQGQFPVSLYVELLDYVKNKYSDSCWQALPKDIAAYAKNFKPTLTKVEDGLSFTSNRSSGQSEPKSLVQKPSPQSSKTRRRICMITHSIYESDNRVLRYAETLAARGDLVEVAALRRSSKSPREEVLNGVRVFRLQDRLGKNEKSKLSFLVPILRFFLVSSWWLTRRQMRVRYDLVHVHNIPDFLVFAAWFPKLMGVKVLLDIHDIVPEFYACKFGTGVDSRAVNALKMMERASARFADHVILSNHLWLDKYTARSASFGKCSVFINNVNTQIFQPRPRTGEDEKQIILFPGGLQWHQGVDIAILAMPAVLKQIPRAEFHIYGDGNTKEDLVALTRDLGLTETVRFFDACPLSEIAGVMSRANLGVVPKRADSFGNEAYSTKIMEFMSLGVPVVVSSTKIDRFYFKDSLVRFFEPGNPAALAEAIVEVLRNMNLRQRLIANALEYANQNSWQRRQGDYLKLVNGLLPDGVVK